jgi:hypothetical protein
LAFVGFLRSDATLVSWCSISIAALLQRSARVLARATAAAWLVALTEVQLLGEALFYEVIDGRVK